MPNLFINGLPASPPQVPTHTADGPRPWGLQLSTLQFLAELSQWSQQQLGIGFEPALAEVLDALQRLHGQHPTVAELAQAARVPIADAERVVIRLAGTAALSFSGDASAAKARRIVVTPRLAEVMVELRRKLDSTFVSRLDLRSRHLHNAVSDARLRGFIDEVFDRFFELEWVHLHHWGGSCYLMSQLLQQVFTQDGWSCRIEHGHILARKGTRQGTLGAPGVAKPGQLDGHAYCIANERWLIDFGLGGMRRHVDRHFFWAVALPLSEGPTPSHRAAFDHARIGHATWCSGAPAAGAAEQVQLCERLAAELLHRAGWATSTA